MRDSFAVAIASRKKQLSGTVVLGLAFILLVILFASFPLPGGDDWQTFYGALQRVLHGQPLYGTKITFSFFYNPPWVAFALLPLGLLPEYIGRAVLSVISILFIFLLSQKWELGLTRFVTIFASPPMFYLLLHGQIDALIIGCALLPREAWVVVAIAKPQTAIALALGAMYGNWKKTILITAGVVLLSFVVLGNWIPAYLSQTGDPFYEGHNLFLRVFPYQMVIGFVLAFLGWRKSDEKYYFGASPFFSPYATMSSMLGPWFLLISKLKGWQGLLLLALWWGKVAYQLLIP